jgi:ubiquinone/menaquinone biosynthesis C-methylase UbiE
MANVRPDEYVPALRYRWLTRFYDTVVALTTRESVFRRELLEQAEVGENDRVLDLACGTGTMAAMISSRYPGTSVAGLDGDPEILAVARDKARHSGLDIEFNEGLSHSMPYFSNEFDIVFSSLFFHHLKPAEKSRTMAEVHRVLKPGGRLHICDWGCPANLLLKLMFLAVCVVGSLSTMLGTLDFISARKAQRLMPIKKTRAP